MQAPPARCEFNTRYFNYENNNPDELFQCEEAQLPNERLCLFHSDTIVPFDQFFNRLNQKIADSVNRHSPILFIGYKFHHSLILRPPIIGLSYIPGTSPENHVAHFGGVSLYFTQSIFDGFLSILNFHLSAAYFDNAEFKGWVTIAASLLEKSTFKESKFRQYANFTMITILEADFFSLHFFESATFAGSMLHKCSFLGAAFDGLANFTRSTFYKKSDLSSIKFNDDTDFSDCKFLDLCYFNYCTFKNRANFEGIVFLKRTEFNKVFFDTGEKATFNASNLSMVSFKHTDITRINFADVQWRDGKNYKIIDEEDLEWSFKPVVDWNYLRTHIITNDDPLICFLRHNGIIDSEEISLRNNDDEIDILKTENDIPKKIGRMQLSKNRMEVNISVYSFSYTLGIRNTAGVFFPLKINLQSILAIYRNLRENYEYRLRYDEAGKFFLREMEIKRKYDESFGNNLSSYYEGYEVKIRSNLRQTISLTGIYYNLSRHGESVLIPTIVGVIIVLMSVLLFVTQANPINEYSLYNFVGLHQITNSTQWSKSFDRAMIDFIPLLNFNSNFHLGSADYVIKLIGGVFTFGFIAIALKRRFERKYRH